MIQLRLFYIFCFSLLVSAALAQEDCTNGIDDDGDNLIDLNDPECTCNGIDIVVPASLFPNPSFEINSCTPGFGRAHCADGWVNPSEGSPDYYDRCNGLISAILPEARCPVPDGDKFFGIANIFENSTLHKEYVGTQLTALMEAGEVYILSFWVGFVAEPDADWSSPPVNFSVYGNVNPDVMDVPYDGKDCPTNALRDTFGNFITPWVEIAGTFISDVNGLGWQQVRIEFTALDNFGAILLGPSCGTPAGMNYYFMDNLVLSKRNTFSNDFISARSGLACNDDLVLEVPDLPDLTYQWYKDGVALIGSSNPVYNVEPLPAGNGEYTCVISNPFGCTMSDGFRIDETANDLEFDAATGICPDGVEIIGLAGNFQSYEWGGGLGNDPTVIATQPATFSVTVVDAAGCVLEGSYELPRYDDVQYTSDVILESAPGAMDGQIGIVHEFGAINPGVEWWDGTTANPHTGLAEGTYCVTITADERCPVEDCIALDLEIQPIVIDADIEQVRCHGESNGSISIAVQGGLLPYSIEWLNHPEWNDQTTLEDLSSGEYRIILVDGQGTRIERNIQVDQPQPLSASLNNQPPTCHNTADGMVEITSVTGGNGNYTYYWNGSSTPGSDRIENVAGGQIQLLVRDVAGCEFLTTASITPPDRIAANIELMHPYCFGSDDGSIHISDVSGGSGQYRYELDGAIVNQDVFDLAGDRTYTVLIQDENGCEFGQEVFLANQVEFAVDLGIDQTIEEFNQVYVNTSSDLPINLYTWMTDNAIIDQCVDCPRLQMQILTSQRIILEALSVEGCIARDSVMIQMTPSKKVYIPTAFSPNRDGVNDYLELFNAGEVDQVGYFQVFNRAGVKLFDIEQVSTEVAMDYWNRSLDDRELNPGTYIYLVELQFKDGSIQQRSGEINIIR